MARIIALDYGTKRVGVAVTDEMQIVANPLDTVHSIDILTFLKHYVEINSVEGIVVGKPVMMSGELSQVAAQIEPFIKQLGKAFPLLWIKSIDERFTSKIAARTIHEAGMKKKDKMDKGLLDKVSAAIILQTYLEMKDLGTI